MTKEIDKLEDQLAKNPEEAVQALKDLAEDAGSALNKVARQCVAKGRDIFDMIRIVKSKEGQEVKSEPKPAVRKPATRKPAAKKTTAAKKEA